MSVQNHPRNNNVETNELPPEFSPFKQFPPGEDLKWSLTNKCLITWCIVDAMICLSEFEFNHSCDAQAFLLLPLVLARPQVGFTIHSSCLNTQGITQVSCHYHIPRSYAPLLHALILKLLAGSKSFVFRLATTSTATRTCLRSIRLLSQSLLLLLHLLDSLHRCTLTKTWIRYTHPYPRPCLYLYLYPSLSLYLYLGHSLNCFVCSLNRSRAPGLDRRWVLLLVARRKVRSWLN